ncbi:MAG: hypothetical protein JO110_02715 [Acetobacteraceae bacterium]|nr:hypothetical protein [Acetobacteraceae bacterium]
MAVDEPPESLGTRVFVPPGDTDRAGDIRVILPRLALPGEEREMHPDLPFIYRLYRPDDSDGSTLVLLHGTGGNETDLLPLGSALHLVPCSSAYAAGVLRRVSCAGSGA